MHGTSVGDPARGIQDRLNPAVSPRILIGIASYGTAQDHYLARLMEEFRRLPMQTTIVVLTNAPKTVEGAEIVVGLPSKDTYSLPFAHKKLFAERVDQFDLFIYTEDDTLITEQNIRAFLDAQSKLDDDEIPGFIRSETRPDQRCFITSINHMFRWLPASVVERGGETFASLSNEHSGCFIVTQKQLRAAIQSGGFVVPPHSERYGMLETAASDLYTQCGLRRLVSLSRIQDFVVPHLANKYYDKMGVPLEDLLLQVRTLQELKAKRGWTGKLFEPSSGLSGFRCSKNLYEKAEEHLLNAVPASAKKVVSVGCGWGANEAWLQARGIEVCAVPLDAVLAASVEKRGIRTVLGPFAEAMRQIGNERFDAVLLSDSLHLLADPVEWLSALRGVLAVGGQIVASIPNTGEIVGRIRDWEAARAKAAHPDSFVQKVSVARLRKWCRSAGLQALRIDPIVDETRRPLRKWAVKQMASPFASGFILVAAEEGRR